MNSGKSGEIYLQLVDTYYMSVMKSVDMKNTQYMKNLWITMMPVLGKINNSTSTKMLSAIVERTLDKINNIKFYFAVQCVVGFAAVICVHSCKNTKQNFLWKSSVETRQKIEMDYRGYKVMVTGNMQCYVWIF